MRKFSYLLLFILSTHNYAFSQIGGNSIYQFLDLTNSARIVALGGDFLPIKENDVSLAMSNPSIINKSMNNDFSLDFVNYFDGINMGFANYSRTFDKLGSFVANIQYVSYGTFIQTDVTGLQEGNFYASEYAISLGWGRPLDSAFSIGANVKSIFSYLDTYRSTGLAVDVAGTYTNPEYHLTVTFIAKNIGTQLKNYTSLSSEPLPFQIEAGISKGFEHAPIRFYLLYNHIEQFDLTYNDPLEPANKVDPITGTVIIQSNISKDLDKLMRHFVIGAEFIPAKYFSIQLGYNYARRKELGVVTSMGIVGFSMGVGIKISKFSLNYSRVVYNNFGGSPNYLTLSSNISQLFRKF